MAKPKFLYLEADPTTVLAFLEDSEGNLWGIFSLATNNYYGQP
jgi:hypothetical protein